MMGKMAQLVIGEMMGNLAFLVDQVTMENRVNLGRLGHVDLTVIKASGVKLDHLELLEELAILE